MKSFLQIFVFTLSIFVFSNCGKNLSKTLVNSPDKSKQVYIGLSDKGQVFYKVLHKEITLIDTSFISFDFEDQESLKEGLRVIGTNLSTFHEEWEMPWGEQRKVENHFNELKVELEENDGLRGQEYNAWAPDGGNAPEHLPIVAFTRMLSGPIDFTPGVFDISLPTKENNQINTTLAKQLALYVVIYSPIQMACDLPENYENQSAFQFIGEVGTDWEQSLTLDGEVGDFVVIAREEKETGFWFVGGISDENEREVILDFDFLDKNQTYLATFYKDTENSHYRENPLAIDILSMDITNGESNTLRMQEGGGFAISLVKK